MTLVGAGAAPREAPRAEWDRGGRLKGEDTIPATMLYGTNTRNERPLMDVLMFYHLRTHGHGLEARGQCSQSSGSAFRPGLKVN
jgi:hypothetical protein